MHHYHSRKHGRRRWGRKYRRYRHPRGHHHVAEIKFRQGATLSIAAGAAPANLLQQFCLWNVAANPSFAFSFGLNQVAFFQRILAAQYYEQWACKAFKIKLWPVSCQYISEAVFTAGNGTLGYNGPVGYVGPPRGGYLLNVMTTESDVSAVTTGFRPPPQIPKAPLTVAQDILDFYPSSKITPCPNMSTSLGPSQPWKTYFFQIPKSARISRNDCDVNPVNAYPDPTVRNWAMNMQFFDLIRTSVINPTTLFYMELSFYCTFYGRDAPILS